MKTTQNNKLNPKQYSLAIRVPTLPSHGKNHLDLFACNYTATIWSEKPQYSIPFSRSSANEILSHFQRVRRLDCRVVPYPPIPESDAINDSK